MAHDRTDSRNLLHSFITSESLRLHCEMVATAMEGYARKLEKHDNTVDTWWTAGLLHDLDWEKFPDEHPNKAVKEILPGHNYSEEIIRAVESHAPDRTGREPQSEIERYLFACDEISGFMKAVALMRPNGFSDMKVKSVTKKLKGRKFAENVPRDDIQTGAELIDLELRDHIRNLVSFFKDGY